MSWGFRCAVLALCLVLATGVEDYDMYEYDEMENYTNTSTTSSPTTGATTLAPVPPNTFKWYQLNDTNKTNQFCFRMNTSITIMISNGTSKSEAGQVVPNTTFDGIVTKQSFCSIEKSKANIFLEDSRIGGVTLGIILSAKPKPNTWTLEQLQFIINDTALSNGPKDNIQWTYFVFGNTSFPYSQDIGYQRFFQCKQSFYVSFTNTTNTTNGTSNPDQLFPSFFFKEVKMQAFQFRNATSGELINGVTCQVESNQGNKIVPIAVGAALAGLVVIVLIAYLIGRFRSRRQSYEPLS